MAVGEGNYGRLGTGQQRRYTDANAETMFSEPATGDTPDEQPGAMPEIFPSSPPLAAPPGIPANISRCWTCRSMFMQAWGNYGTAWAVVHQWLGVQPDLGNGRLTVVPQVPTGQNTVQGKDIRIGRSSVDVTATHTGSSYVTKLDVSHSVGTAVVIGHTLPRGTVPATVLLDGRAVRHYTVRTTNRGNEVTVDAGSGRHTLTITA